MSTIERKPVDWKRETPGHPKPEPTAKKQQKGLPKVSARKVESDKQLDEITPFLLERCKGRCEARSKACTGRAEHHRHHALRRPHTPGKHDPELMLYVCNGCHDYLHDGRNTREAYARRWLIKNSAAPVGAALPRIGEGQ